MKKLCDADSITPDSARGFLHDGKPVFVVCKDGQHHAYVNWCPHLGISLNFNEHQFLDAEGQFIVCANHGALFEPDTGHCLSGPCHGKKLISIACQLRDDGLYIGEVPTPPISPLDYS